MSQVAVLLAAWDDCKEYIARDVTRRAEARASNFPLPINTLEHQAMKGAYEAKYGELDNEEVPGKHYLGMKMLDIDEDEPRAEDLKQVASKADGEVDYLMADVGGDGVMKVRRGTKEGSAPTNAEELRKKHRLMGTTWAFLQSKHANREWLQGLTPTDWVKFSDFVLGKHIAGLRVPGANGGVTGPSFHLILNFEQKLREKAYEMIIRKKMTMSEALKAVQTDNSLRDLYFVTPFLANLAAGGGRDGPYTKGGGGKAGWVPKDDAWTWAKGEGKGKGKGGKPKGKGKGKGAKGKPSLHYKTLDGRDICFAFNNREACDGKCGRIHACQICRKTDGHVHWDCPERKKAAAGQ